jgi:hypothetical protein
MLVYDDKEGVWVWTGRVFSISEQVTKFRDDYANYATIDEWIKLRNIFLFSKDTIWKDDFESSVEVQSAVSRAWDNVCRGGNKQKVLQALDNLAEVLNK